MMAVDHAGAVLRGSARDGAAKPRAEALQTAERRHLHVFAAQTGAPGALFVEAAHGHRQLAAKPLDELHDESLRPTRVQAEHDLQYVWHQW